MVIMIPFGLPLFILLSLPFGCALYKVGLVPTTSQERECKQAYTQGQLASPSYVTAGSAMHVFP